MLIGQNCGALRLRLRMLKGSQPYWGESACIWICYFNWMLPNLASTRSAAPKVGKNSFGLNL